MEALSPTSDALILHVITIIPLKSAGKKVVARASGAAATLNTKTKDALMESKTQIHSATKSVKKTAHSIAKVSESLVEPLWHGTKIAPAQVGFPHRS